LSHEHAEIELDPPRAPEVPPEVVPQRARQVRLPKTLAALRHRNFQLYFVGQLISVAGTWMQIIAQGWLVYELSGSELMLGIVGFASAIPALIVSPWGGVIVDHVPRRTVLILTQAAAMILAFVLAALTFADVVQVWHVIVISALLGVVNSFDGPARQAFTVDMVGHEDLTNAIALVSVVFNGARMIGPAIGGFILASLGAAWCFLINGISFLAVLASLFAMHVHHHPHSHAPGSPWEKVRSGLDYVSQQRAMLGLLLLALVFSVFGISYSTLLPAFVDQVLHRDAFAFGALNATTGVGAVIGGIILARWGNEMRRGRILLIVSIGFPIILMLFSNTPFYSISLLLSVALGLGFMMEFVLINTLLQNSVDNAMRGRVMSLYTLTYFGFSPFGNLMIGALAEVWSLEATLTLSAVITLALVIVILMAIPPTRRLV
jgi:MFS family permease